MFGAHQFTFGGSTRSVGGFNFGANSATNTKQGSAFGGGNFRFGQASSNGFTDVGNNKRSGGGVTAPTKYHVCADINKSEAPARYKISSCVSPVLV